MKRGVPGRPTGRALLYFLVSIALALLAAWTSLPVADGMTAWPTDFLSAR